MDRENSREQEMETSQFLEEKNIIMLLESAIAEEETWVILLEKMMSDTFDKKEKEILRQIRMDDQKHVELLKKIYLKIKKESFIEGEHNLPKNIDYKNAILLKIRMVEFYRQMYYIFEDKSLKDIMFEMITDQQNHGLLLLTLLV